MEATAKYHHGHDDPVLQAHSWRTVKNSADYLRPWLNPKMKILDVGCGPGSITVDLATYVPEGSVTGLERAPEVLSQARALAESRGVTNVEFATGDATALPFADATFDVTHAHQVLQYLRDPAQAIREMRRVTKRGGLVALRDYDAAATTFYPESDGLHRWKKLLPSLTRANGGEPDAGRRLHVWAHQAGFPRASITPSASTWCFADETDRAWFSETSASRMLAPAFAKAAVDAGLASDSDLRAIADAWRVWGADPDAWWVFVHGEVLCRVE